MTLKRSAVQAALADRGDFVSADELHMLLAGRGVRMGLTAVYRALRQLEAAGVLDVTHVRTGRRLFRMRAAEGRRHYLVCRRCYAGRPVDTEAVEQWRDRSPPPMVSRSWSTPSSSAECAETAGPQSAVDDRDRPRPTVFLGSTGYGCTPINGPLDRRRHRRSG